MPVTDAYATAAAYRASITKSDAGDEIEILKDLTAVSRYLDEKYGRFFTKDVADVARDFRPRLSLTEIMIDDLSAVPTSVIVDENDDGTPETTWAATDYELRPLNADVGPEPRPYTKIAVPSWSSKSCFVGGRLVRITGKWGWPAVPKAIERATIHLTAILRLETPRASSSVSELGLVVQASPQARGIIEQLVSIYSRKAYAV